MKKLEDFSKEMMMMLLNCHNYLAGPYADEVDLKAAELIKNFIDHVNTEIGNKSGAV